MPPLSTTEQVARWRMHNLRLSGPPLETAEEVVGWLGAVQSQEYAAAKWSVGQRSTGLRDADVERALAEGRILRTHVLRPTWHFVLPADIRWLLELTRPRVHALAAHGRRREALDDAIFARIHAVLTDALAGGRHLTRPEIGSILSSKAGIDAQGSRLAHVLMHAELEGLICSGVPKGKQHTYALLDERVPPVRALRRDEALVALTHRYFTSHGPASARDFQWWSSLSMADVKRGIELAGSRLEREVVDGVTYWCGASAAPGPAAGDSPRVHLLQTFDEYLVGYSQTRQALDRAGLTPSLFQTINVRNGVVILDTQLAGTWKRTVAKDGVLIEARLHAPFNASQREALQHEADRFAAFLGLATPARVQVT